MEMTSEQRIGAFCAHVWVALSAAVLRQCISGCQSLDNATDDKMRAIVAVKVSEA